MENFEIICKLGSGGFSKVYKVKRKIDNQIYALKKVQLLNLSEKQKLSSLNEIRVLASIKNKNIINYKEAFLDEKDCTLCLVTEFADRGDLENRIKEQKEKGIYFNENDIWNIFIQIVKGLKSLHDMGIIHRDIKSSNIFLFSDGKAKLGDLNVCKILSKDILGHTQTGTPAYAAPEVWMEKPYGFKSDIWSLGCVLYEMVTLKCPFREDNMVKLYNKVLVGEYKKIPNNFSNELKWIIEQMINSEMDKRFSCDEILNCECVKKWIEIKNNAKIKSNSEKTINEYRIKYNKNKTNCNLYSNNFNIIINNKEERKQNESDNILLKTISMPHNLLYLKEELPKPNYNISNSKSINMKSKISNLYDSLKFNDNNNKNNLIILKRNSYRPNYFRQKNNEIYNILNNNKIKKENSGKIVLKHINSTLISKELNNNSSSQENNELLKETGSKIYTRKSESNLNKKINDYLNIYGKQKILEIKNDNKFEKRIKDKIYDIKNKNYINNNKLQALFNSNRKKLKPGSNKDFQFEIKPKNHQNDIMENDRYNNINNDYFEINNNLINSEKKFININSNNIDYNNINNINNYNYKKNENEFVNKLKLRKSLDILPKIKLSYN